MKMKKISLLMLLFTAFVFTACNDDDKKEIIVVNYNDKLSTTESTFATTDGVLDNTNPYGGMYVYQFNDSKNAIQANHFYNDWGFGGGFTYSNTTDKTTPGYMNLSAITAGGKSGSVYLISKTDEFTKATITNLKENDFVFKGAWVTNSTYAYLAVTAGEDGYMNETKFNDGDWFLLTATGHAASGTVIGKAEIYLADYRSGKTEALNTWKWFDWSGISNAAYITFEMTSSDNGEWGMNTPAYFCMDDITLEEK